MSRRTATATALALRPSRNSTRRTLAIGSSAAVWTPAQRPGIRDVFVSAWVGQIAMSMGQRVSLAIYKGGAMAQVFARLARRWYAATFIRLPQTLILHQRRAWF